MLLCLIFIFLSIHPEIVSAEVNTSETHPVQHSAEGKLVNIFIGHKSLQVTKY